MKRNRIHCAVVTSAEQMQHAIAVRSIVYTEGNSLPYHLTFDGNDFVATHFVFYDQDEPIGATRVRWFADFAKAERTCFRKSHQNVRNVRTAFDFVLHHVAQKGYTTLITHADEDYARLWIKLFGFEMVPGRPPLEAPGFKPHFELVRRLTPPTDVIRASAAPAALSRIEGAWDTPGAWDAPAAAD